MADKQKILELDIDVEAIIAKSSQLKSQLDQLRETQDKLKRSGDTSSETYIKNAATISKVSSEYSKNQSQLSNLSTVNSKYLTVQEKLSLAIDKEVLSIGAARTNNTELLKIRNELNLKTEDGAKAAAEINSKLDDNNKFIKENVSAYERQKIGIGDYASGIREAIGDTGIFNGELSSMGKALTALTGPFKLLKDDFSETASRMKNAGKETEGLSTSQKALAIATNIGSGAMRIFALALAATGIGLIIAAIALLIGYFKTFDPIVDKVEQVIAGLGAAVRVVQQALFGFLDGITSVGDGLTKLGKFLTNPIDSIKSLGKEMANAANAAATLKEAQQDLADSQAIQSVNNKKQEAEIARLMLQSKDRGKTEAERIALLQKAEALNAQNFKANSDLAAKESAQAVENARIKGALTQQEVADLEKVGIAYAYKLLNLGKITDEEVAMLVKAEESKIEIYGRATAEQEKIQNRQNALIEKQEAEREARAKKAEEQRQKLLDNAANTSKAQLDLFLSQQGIRAKSFQEELVIAEKVRDKKLEIAQKEFEASEKTEADKLKLITDQNNIKDEFLQKQVDASIENASRELELYIQNNQSKLDSDKYFSEESLRIEQERLQGIFDEKTKFLELEFERGAITTQAYNDQINALNEENRLANEAIKLERDEAQAETDLLNAQNQLALDEQAYQDKFDLETARLKTKKDAAIANAKSIGADTTLIEKLYASYQEDIDKRKGEAKLESAAAVFGGIADLLGRESALGKAAAIAQAMINVFQGVTKAIAEGGVAGIATGALVAISGGLSIAKIMQTKPPEKPSAPTPVKLARGGRVFGRGTSKSDSIDANLSNGETVINAKSSGMFAPLLSAINVAGGGVAFAKGEIPYPIAEKNVYEPNNQSAPIDYDLLANKIGQNVAEANKMLPPNKLILEEFNSANDDYKRVIDTANLS